MAGATRRKTIEYQTNPKRRFACFSKRKYGFFRKAESICKLTGCEVSILLVTESGNHFHYASNANGEDLLKKLVEHFSPQKGSPITDYFLKKGGSATSKQGTNEKRSPLDEFALKHSKELQAEKEGLSSAKVSRRKIIAKCATSGKSAPHKAPINEEISFMECDFPTITQRKQQKKPSTDLDQRPPSSPSFLIYGVDSQNEQDARSAFALMGQNYSQQTLPKGELGTSYSGQDLFSNRMTPMTVHMAHQQNYASHAQNFMQAHHSLTVHDTKDEFDFDGSSESGVKCERSTDAGKSAKGHCMEMIAPGFHTATADPYAMMIHHGIPSFAGTGYGMSMGGSALFPAPASDSWNNFSYQTEGSIPSTVPSGMTPGHVAGDGMAFSETSLSGHQAFFVPPVLQQDNQFQQLFTSSDVRTTRPILLPLCYPFEGEDIVTHLDFV